MSTQYLDPTNQVEETDRRSIVKRTQLDPLGRVRSIERAIATPEQAFLERNTYDGNGNRVLTQDAEDRVTKLVYDNANRLSQRIDAFGVPADEATTSFTYDAAGNLLLEVQPGDTLAEPTMRYQYDNLNRRVDQWDGNGNQTHFDYDEEGHRTLVREPELQTTQLAYDELGKLIRVEQPLTPQGLPVTLLRYDNNRNLKDQEDAENQVLTRFWDERNQLDYIQQEGGLVTDYAYDTAGNLAAISYPAGNSVTHGYDLLNRLDDSTFTPAPLAELPWRQPKTTDYQYDANGNLDYVTQVVEINPGATTTSLTTDFDYDGRPAMGD